MTSLTPCEPGEQIGPLTDDADQTKALQPKGGCGIIVRAVAMKQISGLRRATGVAPLLTGLRRPSRCNEHGRSRGLIQAEQRSLTLHGDKGLTSDLHPLKLALLDETVDRRLG
jgi:hypothetical protein